MSESLQQMLADHEALEGVADWLKTQQLTINIGPVQGDHDEFVESSAGWLHRLLTLVKEAGKLPALAQPVADKRGLPNEMQAFADDDAGRKAFVLGYNAALKDARAALCQPAEEG
jgi:hypothetical protein